MITCCLSSVIVRPSSVHPSTPLNDFYWPSFFKLHVKVSVKGELKIYTNDHGLLIKMAALSIYGKNT